MQNNEALRVLAPARTGTGARRPRRIFVFHGSHGLTDYEAHGDGLVAWGFLSELARRGHRIHVATPEFRIDSPLPPNLTIVRIDPKTGSAFRDYVAYARAARAEFDRFAAEAPVDVVHQMNPVLRGLSLGMLGRNVPIVLGTYVGEWPRLDPASGWTERPPSLRGRANRVGKALVDAVSQACATSLMIATPFARNRLPFAPLLRGRIESVHHGVDLDLFTPERQQSDPAPCPHSIIYVGSLQHKKGVLTLARAFVRVARRVPEAQLILVGDGGEEAMLRTHFTEAGLDDRVTFVGRQPRAGVAAWMRAADVLCAPSFGEPYGQNLLEAMACGKPVVATTAGGHPYLVDARNGANVKPGDDAGLAEALVALLTDQIRARATGAYNRRMVERRHDWSRVTDDLEAVYDRAIARFERRRAGSAGNRRAPVPAVGFPSNDRVTIVIATKNRGEDFARLYRSIREQPTQPHRIVVVDQSDKRYTIAESDDLTHIHDTTINGLTAARNVGILELDDAPYVLFLDDDAEFVSDVVAGVQRAFRMHDDAIGVQCEVEQPAKRATLEKPGFGARIWRRWETVFYRGFFDNRLGPRDPESDEVDRVHGCAMAFRRSLFDRETFDPNLVEYSYGEDWEFSRRAVRYGRLYLARGARVVHHESPTNRLRQRRLLAQRWRNFLYFYEKFRDERGPADALWRYWWAFGETIVWLKKGYGFPSGHVPRPDAR